MKDLYIAKTFAGLEETLAQELRDLNIEDIEILHRAVSFKGDLKDLYTANYWCRTALRILKPIADFPAADELALYKGIRSIDWSKLMGLDDTFAIDATLSNSKMNHSQYAALKTKDAIADQFVFKFKERPNVETTRPTLRISIFIQKDHCTVSLDSSNISLHKRGYRVSTGSAPLNEALAAGMILLSGWDKKSNFVDPMCGSGTLLIEAALIAMNIPPASYRDFFGFTQWKDFDEKLWKEIKIDALEKQVDIDFKISGTDLAAGMIAVAEKNIKSAHLQREIELNQLPMQDFTPPSGGGFMVCNPPYGERIHTRDIIGLYREMGDTLKHSYGGYTAWIISSDIIALKQIGLYPSQKLELYNGPLECRFEKFEIYEGSKKAKYQDFKAKSQNKASRGPAYRKNKDWDSEGKNTKFKGKTKSEWAIDKKRRKEHSTSRNEEIEGERIEKTFSKERPPRRSAKLEDKSKPNRFKRKYSDREEGYAPKPKPARREYKRSDDNKGRDFRRDEGKDSGLKKEGVKREVRKYTREIREKRANSGKMNEGTTYYPKGRPPRKRIPKKPDND